MSRKLLQLKSWKHKVMPGQKKVWPKKKRSNDRLLSNNETFNRNVSSSSIRQPHDAIKHYINIKYKKEVSCFTKYAGLKLICGQSSRLHFEQKDKTSQDREGEKSAKAKMRQLVNL